MTIKLPVQKPAGVTVRGVALPGAAEILSAPALEFVADLARRFEPERAAPARAARARCRRELDAGRLPDFLPETRAVRAGRVARRAALRPTCVDRRVEITGPVERKMIINALNSGAERLHGGLRGRQLADLGATSSRARSTCATRCGGTIDFDAPETGKRYALARDDRDARSCARAAGTSPRSTCCVDGAAGLGLALRLRRSTSSTTRASSLARGTGPYFYLPKLESHLEARLWNDVFVAAQDALGIPRGTIRATVLIETHPRRLRDGRDPATSCASTRPGLNCGRWDYIFSFIKKFRADPRLRAARPRAGDDGRSPSCARYSQLLIQTCHRRGAHAMGGMAAQIPIKDDPARERARRSTRCAPTSGARRGDGHDGTWVAHPGLVASRARCSTRVHAGPEPARRACARTSRVDRRRPARACRAGTITEAGPAPRTSTSASHYLEAWLAGSGCVPLYDLMEDAATAEISRAQVWQWLRHGARLDDGRTVDARARARASLDEELAAIARRARRRGLAAGRFDARRARGELFERLVDSDAREPRASS